MEFCVIIVDENIRSAAVIQSIASWYPGQVIPVTDLRRETLVEDDGIPNILRNLFWLPPFRTKAARMGKIIRVRPSGIEYYMIDRKIHFLPWSA